MAGFHEVVEVDAQAFARIREQSEARDEALHEVGGRQP